MPYFQRNAQFSELAVCLDYRLDCIQYLHQSNESVYKQLNGLHNVCHFKVRCIYQHMLVVSSLTVKSNRDRSHVWIRRYVHVSVGVK